MLRCATWKSHTDIKGLFWMIDFKMRDLQDHLRNARTIHLVTTRSKGEYELLDMGSGGGGFLVVRKLDLVEPLDSKDYYVRHKGTELVFLRHVVSIEPTNLQWPVVDPPGDTRNTK